MIKVLAMAVKIEVLDSIMGSGKSTEIFKWIDDNPNDKYIYVSPNLTEVDVDGRIHEKVNNVKFYSPVIDYCATKAESMNDLLFQGKSIACTHKLYLTMDRDSMSLIEKEGYTVIFDEEINVMTSFTGYSFEDIVWLMQEGFIDRSEEDGSVQWLKEDELLDSRDHQYAYLKSLCDKKSLYITRFDRNSEKAKSVMMVSQVPVRLLECAKRVIAITYMFKGSVLDCFLRLKGFETIPFKEVSVVNRKPSYYKDLITLIPPDKKTSKLPMTSTWWDKKATTQDVKDIQNYILRNARKYAGVPEKLSYTLPKNRVKDLVKGKNAKTPVNPIGFVYEKDGEDKKPTWLAPMIRATNNYREKTVMIHCYNRYPLHPISCYLQDYKQPLDKDVFALSEMLQWIFRGCVREDKPMVVCCASSRMYELLQSWLNDEFEIEGV